MDTDGNKLYGFNCETHHKFLHCVTYKGRVEYGDQSDEVSVHNQGGKAKLGDGTTVKLEQAYVMNCKVLQLSFLKEQEEPIGVVLSSWDASQIGGLIADVKILLERV